MKKPSEPKPEGKHLVNSYGKERAMPNPYKGGRTLANSYDKARENVQGRKEK